MLGEGKENWPMERLSKHEVDTREIQIKTEAHGLYILSIIRYNMNRLRNEQL